MRRIRIQEAVRSAEEEQIRPIKETLGRLMSEWSIMPEARIEPELYKAIHPDTNPDELDRRRKQKDFDAKFKNKLRRAWFTNVLGQIEQIKELLPPLFAQQVKHEHLAWIKRVRETEHMTEEMVHEMETFAQNTITLFGPLPEKENAAMEHAG